jgi:glycosyltransferase involved in cell wall biosynthesis
MPEQRSIWYIHPYAGGPGIGRYDRAYHLAREFRKKGYDCLVICPAWHHLMDVAQIPGERDIGGVKHRFLPVPRYASNGIGRIFNMAIFTLQLVLKAGQIAQTHSPPGVIIASSPHPYAWLAVRLITRRFAARGIFEVRDLWPLSLVELAGVSPRHPLVRFTGWIEENAYRTADAVVSLLPCTRTYMESRGLPADRWHYIPNGISPDDESGTGTDPGFLQRIRDWRAAGCVILVYTGALGRPNHVHSLLDALRILPPGNAEVRTVIVGRGEMADALQRIASTPPLAGKVLIMDQIPKEAVRSLLSLADIGYISLRPEPLFRFGVSPNKLFDYMLSSLPVIAALRAGNDPVSEARCGLRTDPDDPGAIAAAIRSMADMSPDERRSLGENGYRYVLESHSYRRLAETYLRIVESFR